MKVCTLRTKLAACLDISGTSIKTDVNVRSQSHWSLWPDPAGRGRTSRASRLVVPRNSPGSPVSFQATRSATAALGCMPTCAGHPYTEHGI